MRALAVVKATTNSKGKERKGNKQSWEDTRKIRSYSTKQTYPGKPEQSPETRCTQHQGREIFASKSAEQKYVRKDKATKRIEYKKHYSHYQKKPLVDALQEKYSQSPPSSYAWKHEQE
jgi:hypothetical protein